MRQRTLAREVGVAGTGIFTGATTTVTLKPAPAGHGIVLYRTDLGMSGHPAAIPVHVRDVIYRARRTALRTGHAAVETCEHVLSALMAAGVDNVRIEVTGSEMPMGDGSAEPFFRAIQDAGVVEQDAERRTWRLAETVRVGDDRAWIEASPIQPDSLVISYDIDYGPDAPFAPHIVTYEVEAESYGSAIAPARTFLLERELAVLQASGMCQHLTPRELLVIGPDGPMGGARYRAADEPGRHKVLDILGDLALIGRPVWARIRAYRSGHELNHALVRELVRLPASRVR